MSLKILPLIVLFLCLSCSPGIPEGYREIPVKAANAALLKAGDHVDLVATIRGKSHVIVQNAKLRSSDAATGQVMALVPDNSINQLSLLYGKTPLAPMLKEAPSDGLPAALYTVQQVRSLLEPPAPKAVKAAVSRPVAKAGAKLQASRSAVAAPKPTYRAYRAPVRSAPVYRAPARSAYRAPVRSAPRTISHPPVRAAAPAASSRWAGNRMPRLTIRNGHVTDGGAASAEPRRSSRRMPKVTFQGGVSQSN